MSQHYGTMVSFNEAIEYVLCTPDSEKRERVLNRMRYERDKAIPVKPKFHKGQYGKQYDNYTCGNCGHLVTIINNYCPNCGFAIGWATTRCLTGRES